MSDPPRARDPRSPPVLAAVFALAALCTSAAGQQPSPDPELDRMLELSLEELLDVKVITALKQPVELRRVPATVRVISAEQIRDRGYRTLQDALADLPGFQFRDIQGFNGYVFLRGVPSQNNKLLVLIDGQPVNELNSGGFYAGGQYNLAAVSQIEVAYGPASTLYGTNAVSGVIQLVTRADEGRRLRASATLGSFETRAADVSWSTGDAERQRSLFASAMYKHGHKADLGGARGDFNWTEDIDNFETDFGLDLRARLRGFRLGFTLQDKDASRATVQRTLGTGLADRGVDWHIRFANAWASWTLPQRERWGLSATAFTRTTSLLDDSIPVIELASATSPGAQLRYRRPAGAAGSEARLDWRPSASLGLSFGLAAEREWVVETFAITRSTSAGERPPRPADPPSLANDLLSAYAEAQVPVGRAGRLFAGYRHDASSYYGDVGTPRAGLVVNEGRFTGRAVYAEAFRAPEPWDFTDGRGNPGLQPESMRSIELAAGWALSHHLRLDAALYRNRLNDLIAREGVGASRRFVNSGDVDTDGLEAGFEYRRPSLRAFAHYSWVDSRDERGAGVPEIAAHGAVAGLAWDADRRLGFDLRGRYLGARRNPTPIATTGTDRIDDALVLHAGVRYSPRPELTLRLFVDNLTDAVYYHPSNLPPSRYRQPQRGLRFRV